MCKINPASQLSTDESSEAVKLQTLQRSVRSHASEGRFGKGESGRKILTSAINMPLEPFGEEQMCSLA
ncbi:hypothetical protein P7K49_033976, partial [Saguinus oedipus]